MTGKKTAPNPFKDCTKCTTPVHRNAKVCKACGGPSPWAAKEVMPVEAQDMAAAKALMVGTDVSSSRLVDKSRSDVILVDDPRLAPDFVEPTREQIEAYLRSIDPANRPKTPEQIAADDAEAARQKILNGPHVIMEKYDAMIGVTFAHFKPGDVITDFVVLGNLRTLGAPMVPVSNAAGMACCPSCQHVFKVPVLLPAKRAG